MFSFIVPGTVSPRPPKDWVRVGARVRGLHAELLPILQAVHLGQDWRNNARVRTPRGEGNRASGVHVTPDAISKHSVRRDTRLPTLDRCSCCCRAAVLKRPAATKTGAPYCGSDGNFPCDAVPSH